MSTSFTGPPPPAPEYVATADERNWGMLAHLSSLIAIWLGGLGFLGPLLVWQLKKNEYPSVEIHGKAALNFQITVTIALVVTSAAMFIGFFFCIGWLLLPVVILIGLAGTVFAIIAGIKASNGEDYKYPWSLELIK